MSTMSERYVRCPNCNALNLEGSGDCYECGTQVDEQLPGELRRVVSDVWGELGRPLAAVAAGLVMGGLLVLVGGLASQGLWLPSLSKALAPPMERGATYLGPFILAAVPITWLVLGKLEVQQLGGRLELFEADEVQAGAWAAGLLGVILAAVALSLFKPLAGGGSRPFWFWQALPSLCQVAAIATAVVTSRWLLTRELDQVFQDAAEETPEAWSR